MTKYIFVTGGVVSSLGKGITASAIGQLLKSRGLKVFMQKFDPYLNVDPGMMSPLQHGEVFVTADGAETDLDLGHYERFIDEKLNRHSSISSGKIYSAVIRNERNGQYGGGTVQVIPHVTNQIKKKLIDVAKKIQPDVVITEIGGTVGDIESLPFLEAIRQARRDFGYNNTLYLHKTLVPYLKAAQELKTKPTQHSVKELMSLGIHPDIIVLRSEVPISCDVKDKIALFCDVSGDAVFESLDVEVIFEVIRKLEIQGIDDYILKHFGFENLPKANLKEWDQLIERIKTLKNKVKIGLVGKYVSLHDAYLSVLESLKHAGYHNDVEIDLNWIDSEQLTNSNYQSELKDLSGIIIPSGFGKRGTSGMILASKYARENKVPFLGIGLGMQLAVVEYFNNVLGFGQATLAEINNDAKMQLFKIPNHDIKMRLGEQRVNLVNNTLISQAYQKEVIFERHRNRYEFNNEYLNHLTNTNLVVSGISNDENYLESIELNNHPWYVGVLYHPEFTSRPLSPHPLFDQFIKHVKNK